MKRWLALCLFLLLNDVQKDRRGGGPFFSPFWPDGHGAE